MLLLRVNDNSVGKFSKANRSNMSSENENKFYKRSGYEVRISRILKLVMVITALLFYLFLFFQQWFLGLNHDLFQQIIDHYAVFLTLPCAGFAALLLVVIFDEAYGNIKFSIWELNFEGASGPLILWIICYLSIVLSVKLLW